MAAARNTRPSSNRAAPCGVLRIIGGEWRSRKLNFRPAEGLRPTPDRVRETLFNWLAPEVHKARCLDLFSGSGALGLEALSRGGSHCDFVDSNPDNCRQVAAHLATLGAAGRGACHSQAAEAFLRSTPGSYNIVFLDPPFGGELIGSSCELLFERRLVAPDGLIYIEMGSAERLPSLPGELRLQREKTAAAVTYRLYRYET